MNRRLLAHQHRVVKMTRAEEYRINAATCLRLAEMMDGQNKLRFEQIARQWLDLAKAEEEEFVQAAE